jgi:hypothetical protein
MCVINFWGVLLVMLSPQNSQSDDPNKVGKVEQVVGEADRDGSGAVV